MVATHWAGGDLNPTGAMLPDLQLITFTTRPAATCTTAYHL